MISKGKFVILDGAMGTMLQKSGLPLGERPEVLAITNRAEILAVHKMYVDAGSDIIYTNTFGANELKLAGTGYEVEEVVTAGVSVAREATSGSNTLVAFDIGPIGELLEPVGTLPFERAYDIFKRMAIAGEKAGADLIVLETMTDIYEVKAAVLAVKENTHLPIIVSMTFEANGRTFTGTSIESMATLLEGLGVDAVGINCSLGPVEIYPLAKRLCESTALPIFVKPNAGLPDPATGAYSISAEQFASELGKYAELGICMVGGCCGTTPDYIRAIRQVFDGMTIQHRNVPHVSRVSTASRVVNIDDVRVIGERINPTGKKLMREALLKGDMGYILRQAVQEADAGADILDVNVGAPGIDEVEVLPRVVKAIQSVVDLPLQLDCSNVKALEAALRVYNGKPIVNSVNGNDKVLDSVLPLVKKYGASVVGLTLDESGVPDKSEDRFEIACHILAKAMDLGIPREDVYIDALTLTCSAQQEGANETLKTLSRVKEELGLKTVLGVSNISFGLPNRGLLNYSFLLMALSHGLDLPIINPNTDAMMDAVRAYRVLSNKDKGSVDYIEQYKDYVPSKVEKVTIVKTDNVDTCVHPLIDAIKKGLDDEVRTLTLAELEHSDPMTIVNEYLIPALDIVGEGFEKGRLFLPQLLKSATSAEVAFGEIKKVLSKTDNNSIKKGPIILATVEGDIHDIGKNIVKVILENYGFDVIDLGRDVKIERVVQCAKETDAPLVGLSALMTTTLKSMEKTITALHEAGVRAKIMVGGAVLTRDYALEIGADYYSKDAKESADIAKKVIG